MRARVLGGAVAALVLALGALAAPAGAADKVLRVRFGADISGMDPASIFQIENQTIAGNVFNGLVKYHEKTNEIVPDLATKWEVSSDGKVYTFTLRKGVKWHKGFGDFTSADVKYTIERIQNPANKSRYVGEFASVEKVETPDPSTVRITLKYPYSGFLHKVAAFNQGWIVNRKAVETLGDRFALEPVGTGPWVFSRWTPGSEVQLEANKQYFEGAPKMDRVVFKIMREEGAAEIALLNGEIDIFFAMQSADVINRLREGGKVDVQSRPGNNTLNLVLNTTVKPLDNVKVRQAIAYGIDRKSLVQDFFKGLKGEATSVLTSNFPEYTKDVPQYPYDPDRAKRLLAEAGVPNGFNFEIVSVALQPYDKIPVVLADDLGKIGIKTKITVLERGAYNQARAAGNIPTAITAIVGPPDPDSPLWRLYHSSSFPPGMNTSRYSAVDGLLEAAQKERDKARRMDLYKKIQQQTMTDMPVVPLYEERLYIASRKNVKGLTLNSLFTVNVYPVSVE